VLPARLVAIRQDKKRDLEALERVDQLLHQTHLRHDLRNIPPEIQLLWACEACFICGVFGFCRHREIGVAMARIEGMRRG
jgi:hypothetical protein